VSLGAEVISALSSRITWYQNWIKDAIGPKLEPGNEFLRNKNFDKMRTEGLEVEMKYDFGRGSYLSLIILTSFLSSVIFSGLCRSTRAILC